MATCDSLRPLFENPIQEKPTLIESLSTWNSIKPIPPVHNSSFTEIFGELHFKEKPETPPEKPFSASFDFKTDQKHNSSLESLLGKSQNQCSPALGTRQCYKNSDSLQLCTEGLGFESSDDVERELSGVEEKKAEGRSRQRRHCSEARSGGNGAFPPPISCIGSSGKPCVYLKSFKSGGRFVLREMRIPTQDFLHASREGGRLKLHFVQPDHGDNEQQKEQDQDDSNDTEMEESCDKNCDS